MLNEPTMPNETAARTSAFRAIGLIKTYQMGETFGG